MNQNKQKGLWTVEKLKTDLKTSGFRDFCFCDERWCKIVVEKFEIEVLETVYNLWIYFSLGAVNFDGKFI